MVIYLYEELLTTQIRLINEFHRTELLEPILIKMQPLVKKYIRKLYFMEKEDASQELNLALIEAIYHLKIYNNDAMSLTYLKKSVINKYNYLCKSNIKSVNKFNEFEEISEDLPYIEKFNDIEFFIDANNLLKSKSDKQKYIIKYIFSEEFSDSEIASILGVSRQYINKIKKKIFKELY
jgi:RNA polymerase sigma factor (sigma-70 family)